MKREREREIKRKEVGGWEGVEMGIFGRDRGGNTKSKREAAI